MSDGSGVAWAHWTFGDTDTSTVEVLDPATGAVLWNGVCSFRPEAWASGGSHLALAAAIFNPSPPDGQELSVECFDLVTGGLAWSAIYPGPTYSDEPHYLAFDAAESNLFSLIARTDTTFGRDVDYQVRAIDASTGASPWLSNVHPISEASFLSRNTYWMDIWEAAGAPTTVTAGWGGELWPESGLRRTTLDAMTGAFQETLQTSDRVPALRARTGVSGCPTTRRPSGRGPSRSNPI